LFFFFQAEDGIRDWSVTGVQTCALPISFSRVYAASGSWVAFRGGHEFPTMVRKFEARPIRAYLTTATHDMENAAGDWFLLDQERSEERRVGKECRCRWGRDQ